MFTGDCEQEGGEGIVRRTIKAFIHRGENYYVAECLELAGVFCDII